jgi:hypothetical protein
VIYCVVPAPLADQLYDKLVKYYENDPNVTVIVDRRSPGGGAGAGSDRRGQEPTPARRERDRPPVADAADPSSVDSSDS